MKNLTIILFVLFPVFLLSQTQTENYIKTTTYKVETTISVATPTVQQAAQNITYFDGLGRPIQQVAHQQSGSGKDIVTPMEYDGFGRQDKEYLPFVPNTPASLDYKSSALADVLTFYDHTKYDADFSGMVTSGVNPVLQINPYSQKGFEASPLNRILKQAAPGKDWKLGNGHEIKIEYQTNTDADAVWSFGVYFIDGNTEDPYLGDNGAYASSQLYKTITKDENWMPNQNNPSDHTTQEFKDKEGRVILKRNFDAGKWHDTYYVYDDYGNLTYVLPPKFLAYSSITQAYTGQSTYRDSDAMSFFATGNGYAELYMSNPRENVITLNMYSDGFTPGAVLQSGLISDLDFQPYLPDMPLGNIMVPDANGNSVVGGTAYIQNGNLYFSSTGAGVYQDLNGNTELSLTLTSPNLSNYQSQYIPPMISIGSLDDLCYQYKYDKRNRLIEKKMPGKEWEYIVYDKIDRPILTQDANLRTANKWLFTKYDVFSRPVYTGEYINTSETTRTSVQALADAGTVMFETKQAANTINGTTVYYSNNAFPNTSNINLFTINYYDDYNFDLNGAVSTVPSITNAKGLATGSKVRVLGTSNWITNVSYYDTKSRPIYSYSKNDYLATTSTVQSQLDFVGKVLETTSTHQRNNVTTTVVDAFTYDHAGRLLKQTQAINGASTPEIIVANTYDELGQLTSKKVGGKTIDGLQKVDYAYNIRGWLKSINDTNNYNQDNDLFAFGLNYNTIANTTLPVYYQNKPLYNGNISGTSWKTNSLNPVLKQYNYTYDALNRFKTASYAENNIVNNKFYENINGYDRNGNIMGLYRLMQSSTNANSSNCIDYLTYTYDNGNKLMRVNDSYKNNPDGGEGFKDGNNNGDDYSYDANGNMKKDLNKGIGTATTDGIAYNHLNLPTQITFATGTIDYVYDATGGKQRKIVSTGVTTDYAGGFQYEKIGTGAEMLKFFPTPEGYAENNNGTFSYIYQYKDHLGNVRLSYKDVSATSTPSLQIVEENNYYPFGMRQKVAGEVINQTGYKYKYNGKELQDELGLNMYDYGARNYDPALGRFMNIDPMAESYYQHTPYNYVGSNPIIRTDPTGMDWYTDAKGNQTYNENLTKDNASSILKDGQNYSGTTASETVPASEGVGGYNINYNADGSMSSTNSSMPTSSTPEQESYFSGYFNGPNSGEYGPSSMNPDATSFSLSGEANGIFGKGSFTVGVAFNRFGTDGGFYYSGNASFGLSAEIPSFGVGLEFNSHNNYGGNKDVIAGIGGTDLMYSGSLGLGGAYGRTADRTSQGGYKWAESGVSTTTFNIGIGSPSFHKNIEKGNIIKFSEIARCFKP